MAEPTDDELEIDLSEEETPQDRGTEGEEQPQPSEAEKKINDLVAEVAALRAAGGNSGTQMAELVALGKQFLQAQAKPSGDPAADKVKIAAFGRKLKELVLTGEDDEIANFFVTSIEDVSRRQVDAAIARVGSPMADKAGAFALQMFLQKKQDETPANVHKAVAKNFSVTDDERRSLATASSAQVADFLEAKYERAAGKVLLNAGSRIASPRSMGGAGGGGTSGGNVATFPGMSAAESERFEAWAAELWPDAKVRAEKIKSVIKRMNAQSEAS